MTEYLRCPYCKSLQLEQSSGPIGYKCLICGKESRSVRDLQLLTQKQITERREKNDQFLKRWDN